MNSRRTRKINRRIRKVRNKNSRSGRMKTLKSSKNSKKSPSLMGTWRLIWTTAPDVVSLQASPVLTVGAIHQVYGGDRVVTNVIDFVPRSYSAT